MELVVTLIADPQKAPLSATILDSMASRLSAQGAPVQKTHWLAEHAACDLFIAYNDVSSLDALVQQALGNLALDAIVQPVAGRRKKLLVSDMESTIITVECLDELAEFLGIKDRIAAITARAMNGELDFSSALRERVGLLKDLPASALQRVMDEKVALMPGAQTLVSVMRENGAHCMLVSGGFDFYTVRIREQLGFHEDRANRLEIKDGKLTGQVIPPILGKEAKLATLQEACVKLGITPSDAVTVGDGANDLPMLLGAGLGVAYYAKPSVRSQANARINHGDLTALLYAQGYTQQDLARYV